MRTSKEMARDALVDVLIATAKMIGIFAFYFVVVVGATLLWG